MGLPCAPSPLSRPLRPPARLFSLAVPARAFGFAGPSLITQATQRRRPRQVHAPGSPTSQAIQPRFPCQAFWLRRSVIHQPSCSTSSSTLRAVQHRRPRHVYGPGSPTSQAIQPRFLCQAFRLRRFVSHHSSYSTSSSTPHLWSALAHRPRSVIATFVIFSNSGRRLFCLDLPCPACPWRSAG